MSNHYLASRAVIRLSPLDEGEDVRAFLQGLVTNDVTGQLPCWAALLSPQGKVLFDFLVWDDGTDLLLDCEASQAEALIKRLSLYRLRRKIEIAKQPSLRVFWADKAPGGIADPRTEYMGVRWIAASAEGDFAIDDIYLARRLALGVCEGSTELADLLWLECNAAELNGVSFTKGCYVGQENTARMNWRAKVNRRLVVVPLADSDPKRQRAAYPELGLAVDHLRVEDIKPEWRPSWMVAE
ncbi:MAG: folate-binding protein YgfZ [Novosphingobium sp.]|nr:folate-binding protein YgfZ [Novosphingobium sp.]